MNQRTTRGAPAERTPRRASGARRRNPSAEDQQPLDLHPPRHRKAAPGPRARTAPGRSTLDRWLLRLALVATLALAGEGAWIWYQSERLETVTTTVGTPATPGARPLVVVQLSDLHLANERQAQRVAQQVADARPDFVAITGDALDERSPPLVLTALLAQIRVRLKTPIPIVAVRGNHEFSAGLDPDALARTYERDGARLLHDEAIVVRPAGCPFVVLGIDDGPLARRAESMDAVVRPPWPALVLTHHPRTASNIAHRLAVATTPPSPAPGRRAQPWRPLVLAGHTHGGQIQIAGRPLWLPPGSDVTIAGETRPVVAGLFDVAGADLFVSSGIGTSLVPLRFGPTPRVERIEWHPPGGCPAPAGP